MRDYCQRYWAPQSGPLPEYSIDYIGVEYYYRGYWSVSKTQIKKKFPHVSIQRLKHYTRDVSRKFSTLDVPRTRVRGSSPNFKSGIKGPYRPDSFRHCVSSTYARKFRPYLKKPIGKM